MIETAVKRRTAYFSKVGRRNTEEVLRRARERAQELGISTIIVATGSGDTAVKAAEYFRGYRVVVVTRSTGRDVPDLQELTDESRRRIQELGGVVLTTTHIFGGIGRAVRRKLGAYQVDELIAFVLRVFGQGVKVCCEITMMAADAGLARTDEEVIAIAGTARGADTALVLKPAHAQDFFDIQVEEIICKPRQWLPSKRFPVLQQRPGDSHGYEELEATPVP
ncbi:MAG: hypothetical protein HYU86_04235 [Chloroflexi bacterium]|nr:hypothetical protein [Chloroflexota bacterium]